MIKNLVCFTASFPYHNREAFFEAELKYLSEAFEHIYIIPTYNPGDSRQARKVPDNVTYIPPVSPQGFGRIVKGLLNVSPLSSFIADFFQQRVYKDRQRILHWANSILVFRTQYAEAKKLLRKMNPEETLLYAYWAEIPLFTTKAFRKYKKAVRMHGGDFYLSRNRNYLPLRKQIYRNSNLLLPISQDIRQILIQQYRIPPEKIELSYLGVYNEKKTLNPPHTTLHQPIILVSCSNVVALKRVHKIVEMLHFIPETQNVVWHHFGDGPLLAEIKKMAEALPDHIKASFHGWVTPQQLARFYTENHIDWMINTSKFEGVPVSIMEAMSFGIPVIATDVGATREIVDQYNGYLIPEFFEPDQVAGLVLDIKSPDYENKRKNALKTWKDRFDADRNYKRLIEALREI